MESHRIEIFTVQRQCEIDTKRAQEELKLIRCDKTDLEMINRQLKQLLEQTQDDLQEVKGQFVDL